MKKATTIILSFFISFIVLEAQIPRKVIHESFTGSTCSPCAPAGDSLSSLLHNNEGNYTVIKYQLGGDPYVSAEAVGRVNFYQGGGGYAIPYIAVDGNHFKPNDVNMDGTFNDNYSQAMFEQHHQTPSYLEVNLYNFSVIDQTVEIDVKLISHDDFSGIPKLHIAIIEDVTYNNIGTNGQTEFHYVMKKMLPNQNGTSIISLNNGDTLDYNYSYTFQGSYDSTTNINDMVNHNSEHTVENFSNLSVVAFVQGTGQEVLQSEWSISGMTGVESEINNISYLKVYPNPLKDIINIDYFLNKTENVSINIYNNLGQMVFNKNLGKQIPGSYNSKLKHLFESNGTYFIELIIGSKKYKEIVLINP